MKDITSISIPKPCQQLWQQMTPAEQGKHCAQCYKTVTDFTLMTNNEVMAYLSNTNNICGRFGKQQLNNLNTQFCNNNLPVTGGWKGLALLMSLTGIILSFKAVAQNKPVITEQAPKDQSSPRNFVLGKVRMPDSIGSRLITGRICDESNQALPGATIKLLSGIAGTQSDKDGNFKLRVSAFVNRLLISSIGYSSITIEINKTDFYEVKLQPMVMGEVMVVRRPTLIKRIYYKCIKRPIRKIFN
ncbi:carboxypeptidase-like regulatory domain-containing protein [Mucilaginibacter sp. FT3.2]|uniref:carboxypeptidase-like regulatory domain-containing protein n=1 Tax=Mucilaginibacter sp. FT3.2 TaxID=2723090 RepID=UPI001620C067|nr:carboxypeptidase-like regulatory domain-containing protein [Mucilaginibacter sp. FT3.2]MBB6234713.1 hypothetical protein [Mucilaginibacter sp. FT3.2]